MLDLWSGDSLEIMEVIGFQSIEFGEVKFSEDNRLSVESPFQLQETLTYQVDWIFKTLIFRHYVDIFEDLDEMQPVLHY